MAEQDINHFLEGDGLDTEREKDIGQHIGYRYDVNLVPDMARCTPFLRNYIWVTRKAGRRCSTATSTAG